MKQQGAQARKLIVRRPASEVETGAAGTGSTPGETLLPRDTGRGAPTTGWRTPAAGLPADLLTQSARRLRVLAALYSFAFFMSNPLPALLFAEERAAFLGSALRWAPSTVSIGTALSVLLLTFNRRIAAGPIVALGLLFEVAGSFGIATAQYLDVSRYAAQPPWGGLSWVAVWMLGFTVVLPSRPRWALAAALASASSVPLVTGFALAAASGPAAISPMRFVLRVVLPYLIVVLIAYVGSRIIYRLGHELARARQLGSYQLVERLASGGMGEVWRARHRLLARPAAVKLMRPDVQGSAGSARLMEMRARFEREAHATSLLRSPHTIQLYDFGVADDGAFYYVMELLDGFDLQEMVERFGPLPAARAVHLLLQVCDSLDEAHAAGLVHRDVKPANVYACRYGREVDFVKVLDFGLVKARADVGGTVAGAIAERAVGGTPAFMSPEQVLDRSLDARSDIYSLGCLAYWLVTGELVFSGASLVETALQHTEQAPIPPSRRTELQIPEAFDRLVLACLEKDPEKRPATAEAVASLLLEVRTREPWTKDAAIAWWDRHYPVDRTAAGAVAH